MRSGDLVKGAVAGAAAGLLASFVMNQFQTAWSTAEKQISPATGDEATARIRPR
jgi:hypothetical protein